MVECSGKSQGSEKGLSRGQFVHCEPHTDCPWREPGPPRWYSGQGRPETCAPPPPPGQVNNLAPLRTDILENFFDLQQGWRIFLRAHAQIWYNFRRNSFRVWKTRIYLHCISDYSNGLGAPCRLGSRAAARLAVIWSVTVGKLMQLPAGVTRMNFTSGFVPLEWAVLQLTSTLHCDPLLRLCLSCCVCFCTTWQCDVLQTF